MCVSHFMATSASKNSPCLDTLLFLPLQPLTALLCSCSSLSMAPGGAWHVLASFANDATCLPLLTRQLALQARLGSAA